MDITCFRMETSTACKYVVAKSFQLARKGYVTAAKYIIASLVSELETDYSNITLANYVGISESATALVPITNSDSQVFSLEETIAALTKLYEAEKNMADIFDPEAFEQLCNDA
jgi:hypothetical protein